LEVNYEKENNNYYRAIVAVIAVIGSIIGSYNGFVDSFEEVETARSTISTQLQRRADLIPNFVNTVKGYSDYEQKTYLAVTEARSAVSKANTAAEKAEAAAGLNSAIDVWVNAITEAYPELKANENYKALQDELAGTENRIAVARKDYNEIAQKYNKKIKRFPGKLLAGIFGFDAVDYFEADDNASSVPEVNF
jgi:LemA protein